MGECQKLIEVVGFIGNEPCDFQSERQVVRPNARTLFFLERGRIGALSEDRYFFGDGRLLRIDCGREDSLWGQTFASGFLRAYG